MVLSERRIETECAINACTGTSANPISVNDDEDEDDDNVGKFEVDGFRDPLSEHPFVS